MTTATDLCGHRWDGPVRDHGDALSSWHTCVEPAAHADPCPCPAGTCTVHCTQPPAHRCRCGATTTREGER